jgi:hypothetical protein
MKKYYSPLIFIAVLSLLSCNKGKKHVFSSDFNSQSDLEQWVFSGDGDATLEDGILSFTNIASCYTLEVENLIDIKKDQSYRVKIRSKHIPSQTGDPAFCISTMLVRVKQDSETLLKGSTTSGSYFVEKEFTFTAETSSPIALAIRIGTVHGTWIDYISVERI